ncbi:MULTISPECIES: zinc-ribbon domain-containing protein [Serratia]|uniref:Zinc-ribbon domain-containing protein n=1 Tax=Serratia rubidaea TaxID=61652 RepID=A0ABS0MCW9_SERRU|nr:zinc-ribbon domain-containing protein [Serratia rubidaea]MBU3893432.1 zinc-ribbon domain-containing protein [Serratia rubidaea]
MALKNCKECGQKISSSAHTCPQCGAKNSLVAKFVEIVLGIIGLAIIVPILYLIFSS